MQKDLPEIIFGGPAQIRHRRVRNRAVTLGNISVNDRLTSLFTPPTEVNHMASSGSAETMTSDTGHLMAPIENEAVKRLGSPFSGIGIRPSRARGRHIPSASLSSYDPSIFSSIDQRLGQFGQIGEASQSKTLH